MSQQKASGFSSKILGLRFMQRAAEKRKLEEDTGAVKTAAEAAGENAEATPAAAANESACQQPSSSGRCIVIYEPVPLPGPTSRSGRMSFGPSMGKLKMPTDGEPATTVTTGSQPSISDLDMAKTFRRPPEMQTWEPSNLRIHDAAEPSIRDLAISGGGGGSASCRGAANAAAAVNPGMQKSAGPGSLGKKSVAAKATGAPKAAWSGAGQTASTSVNAFAPLRPPKRNKA
ncbi:hypothetical protein Vretimale_8407 [Volvox reticuliferus]|uniref:Uncharacterized protein n=1 Tax=Volvox reticuliferus TaxID=1737510 RepID=A0A8J4CH21_9CHLO|nr:hypothetical protein Vretifemale_11808 [Volvox reticuliferus]GIM03742.1 hypothetical protein Vretimale_8407 [Volvox reticuliferus]